MAIKHLCKSLLITCIIGMASLNGNAQTISTNFDDKVIWADSLNLPESTIAEYIIGMLPELLERPGDFMVNDYTIKVEDMPVGNAVDAVLTQIRLCDIEKIAVSESPLTSYENNSKSGSINIILKQRATEKKPHWGSASVDFTSPCNILPNVSFGYKKDKFMVRAIALGEFYNATLDTDVSSFDPNGKQLSTSNTSVKDKFWTNLTTLFMNYDISPKDKLALNVSFLKGNEKEDATLNKAATPYSMADNTFADLRAFFKYDHKFAAANELHFEFQYNRHPIQKDVTAGADLIDKDNKDNNICGQLKLKLSLLSPSSKYRSYLFIGSNGNASFSSMFADHQEAAERHSSDDKLRSRGLTPFVEWENYLGQINIKLQANLQYYHYDFQREGTERMEKDNTDFAGKLMLEWRLKKGQLLRFIGEQQVKAPSETMIYPYLVEDVATKQHVKGNFDLKNTRSNNFTIDYIYSNNWGDNSLTLNVSSSFNHISEIMSSETKIENGTSYVTYKNTGKSNVLINMLMAMYKYKFVSLTLTADYYNNFMKLETGNNHYRYYDIVLMPSFKTKTNWMGSIRLIFNSPVDTGNMHKGSVAGVSFQLGKSWGPFNVHAFGSASLVGRTTDVEYQGGGYYSETTSQAMKNCAGIGVRYSF